MSQIIGSFIGRIIGTRRGKNLIRRLVRYGFHSYIDFEGRQIASPMHHEPVDQQRAKAMLKLAPMLMSEIFPTLENVRLTEPDAIFLENFRRAYIQALQTGEAQNKKLLSATTDMSWWTAGDNIEAADKFIKLLTVAVQADNYPRDMLWNALILLWAAYEHNKRTWEESEKSKFIKENPDEEPTYINALSVERREESRQRLEGIIQERTGKEVKVTRDGTRYTIKEVDHGKHCITATG